MDNDHDAYVAPRPVLVSKLSDQNWCSVAGVRYEASAMHHYLPTAKPQTLTPGPLPLALAMLAAVAVYVVVAGATVRPVHALVGLGLVHCAAAVLAVRHRTVVTWPVAVATAVALQPSGAVLGIAVSVAVAGVVATAVTRQMRVFAAVVLADLPPAMFVVACVVWLPAGPGSVAALLVGGSAGVIAGRWGIRVADWALPSRSVPAASTRPIWEPIVVGALAGMLGLAAAAGSWTLLLAMLALMVVISAEYADRARGVTESVVVVSMVAALEARDLYTGGHAVRVAETAALIADEMRLDSTTTRRVVIAALLHDIGKIATPLNLLRKPGRLTPEEYATVQLHAQAAEAVLDGIEALGPITEIVSGHHRHLDGTGYGTPEESGLSVEARIVAVADAFDAMTSHRPYRSAMTLAATVTELCDHVGTQFDEEVVEALLRALPAVEPPPLQVDSDARHDVELLTR